MNEKPSDGSQFFGAFPSNRIPKATKDVNVHFFTHSNNSCEFIPANSGNVFGLLRNAMVESDFDVGK